MCHFGPTSLHAVGLVRACGGQSPPSEDVRELAAPVFKLALRRRTLCGSCMDKFGDHALACQFSTDRTIRHSAVPDCVGQDAAEAGLQPDCRCNFRHITSHRHLPGVTRLMGTTGPRWARPRHSS